MTMKQLFLTSCILTASLAQAVSMKDFDRSNLNPYIIRAEEAVKAIKPSTLRSREDTRNLQKEELKKIKKELKNNKKELKKNKETLEESLKVKPEITEDDKAALRNARQSYKTACQLYKAFKNDVYKNWKETGSFPAIQ